MVFSKDFRTIHFFKNFISLIILRKLIWNMPPVLDHVKMKVSQHVEQEGSLTWHLTLTFCFAPAWTWSNGLAPNKGRV